MNVIAGLILAEEAPGLGAYEKLRSSLTVLVGVTGFTVLARRALTLAKRDTESLVDIWVGEDGTITGLTDCPSVQAEEGANALISNLLALLVSLIGQSLTERLVHEHWPNLPIESTLALQDQP